MKVRNRHSFYALVFVFLIVGITRLSYWQNNSVNGYNATSWDAFGYYIYLPSTIIYQDINHLRWLPKIDSTYRVTGGKLYQANKTNNGNYVFKYLGGVGIMQLPFFFVGHFYAYLSNISQDGFSWPYQYAIILGAIVWAMAGLFVLRKFLLEYYSDRITGFTIMMIVLGTNLLQYIAIDGAMSHVWIFPMYCLILLFTDKWHKKPSLPIATIIGFIIGLATITRPTEIIMIFIPLLWGIQSKLEFRSKWILVTNNLNHVLFGICGILVGILPQLVYWKLTTGSFIYDVGSKWFFLNPWFRILFGFYSGWFIYTPITIFVILGLWTIKNMPFKTSVIVFILLNIWIVLAWSDWQYGVSYAGRALSQGSAIYSLSLASFITKFYSPKSKIWFILIAIVLILINLYQIVLYNSFIYHNFSIVESIANRIRDIF